MTGLGQDTGGDDQARSAEARRILAIIEHADLDVIEHHCGPKAAKFIWDMREWALSTRPEVFTPSGKQIFWLRDISGQLIEKGVI